LAALAVAKQQTISQQSTKTRPVKYQKLLASKHHLYHQPANKETAFCCKDTTYIDKYIDKMTKHWCCFSTLDTFGQDLTLMQNLQLFPWTGE